MSYLDNWNWEKKKNGNKIGIWTKIGWEKGFNTLPPPQTPFSPPHSRSSWLKTVAKLSHLMCIKLASMLQGFFGVTGSGMPFCCWKNNKWLLSSRCLENIPGVEKGTSLNELAMSKKPRAFWVVHKQDYKQWPRGIDQQSTV